MAVEKDRIVADLVLVNGTVHTVDPRSRTVDGVAVLGDTIVAVGGSDEVRQLAGDSSRVVDLQGATVIPGMIDNHVHQILGGLDSDEAGVKVNISHADTIAAIKQAIHDAAKRARPGEWILTSCLFRGALKDGRFPNRHDLDEVASQNPVYIMDGGKNIIVNTRALELAGITRDTPEPGPESGLSEGHIVRDETGEPTGHLLVGGGDLARKRWWEGLGQRPKMWDFPRFDQEAMVRGLKAQMRSFNAAGITSVRDMGVAPEEIDAYVALVDAGEATVRTDILLGLPARYLSIEEILSSLQQYFGPKQGFGNDWLRIGGIKIVVQNYGYWSLSPEKTRALIIEGNRMGWSFAIHGAPCDVGDDTLVILDAIEEANSERPIADRRWCYEHNFGMTQPERYERVKRLGMIIACNPLLAYYAAWRSMKMHEAMEEVKIAKDPLDMSPFDRARREWSLPIRSWMKAGLVVTGGTDSPGVVYDIEHPLLGFWSACTQQTRAGQLLPDETITRDQALRMYTINNAYATFEEHRKGSIEPGKLADMVILTDDLLSVSDEELLNVKVSETIVGGKTTYDRAAV